MSFSCSAEVIGRLAAEPRTGRSFPAARSVRCCSPLPTGTYDDDRRDGPDLSFAPPETYEGHIDIGSGARMKRPELLDEIGRRLFESCPICGGLPEKDEHVPPKSIGGVIMTRTCGACNQTFGGRVEGGVKDWFYGVISDVVDLDYLAMT